MRKLSQFISKILRHQAINLGLKIDKEGFVLISDLIKILKKNKYFKDTNLDTILEIVKNDNKKRFSTKIINHQFYIRANQGHSIPAVNISMLKINDPKILPICIHGTYKKYISDIKKVGLSKMKRNHIHMASNFPKKGGVISGMRSSCDTIIYINVEKAMNLNIEFYQSENGVILSPGNKDGIIPFSCFEKIEYK